MFQSVVLIFIVSSKIIILFQFRNYLIGIFAYLVGFSKTSDAVVLKSFNFYTFQIILYLF